MTLGKYITATRQFTEAMYLEPGDYLIRRTDTPELIVACYENQSRMIIIVTLSGAHGLQEAAFPRHDCMYHIRF